MKPPFLLALILVLAGCAKPTPPKQGDVEIGRYKFLPAANGSPSLVLDTATGCVEQLWVTEGVVVKKASVTFANEADQACSASGITAIREGTAK